MIYRNNLSGIKAILFDIDDTLLDFRQCARAAMIESFNNWDIPFKEEYLDIFFTINDEFWKRYEKGEITREFLYNHRWVEIFKILGIDVDGAAFERDYVASLYHTAIPEAGVKEVLDYLSSKYDLYIVSNSSLDEQVQRLNIAGLLNYFKQVFTSEDLGVAKPALNFFNKVLEELPNLSKNEILIVGDSLSADVAGGKNAGIKTGWFNKKNVTDKEIDCDLIFTELADLKRIL